jgi:hypothetical protein
MTRMATITLIINQIFKFQILNYLFQYFIPLFPNPILVSLELNWFTSARHYGRLLYNMKEKEGKEKAKDYSGWVVKHCWVKESQHFASSTATPSSSGGSSSSSASSSSDDFISLALLLLSKVAADLTRLELVNFSYSKQKTWSLEVREWSEAWRRLDAMKSNVDQFRSVRFDALQHAGALELDHQSFKTIHIVEHSKQFTTWSCCRTVLPTSNELMIT